MDVLIGTDAKKLISKAGLKVAKSYLAKDNTQAIYFSKKIGYPVVMKISSKDIIHKTEAKGVKTDIMSEDDASRAYDNIIDNAYGFKKDAIIDGVMIEEQVSGYELIIGAKRDMQFGPVVMFGFGGIFVETFKDVTFRVVPLDTDDAYAMMKETKAFKILEGVRGKKPANIKAIAYVLMKVSKLMEQNADILELDINPLIVDENKAIVADIRIVKQ
ncbi:MAG: acetate--CoA ligase family protein [DPANN group archaeon]|nr:acetate--CoA ligase family protein [DPANN group archaeon]